MLLSDPSVISKIDKYAAEQLGIPMRELMRRAGAAVADAVRSLVPTGSKVLIFAGKGNNGGDGYAAASMLFDEYEVIAYDVFSAGQRSDEGRFYLDAFRSFGGRVVPLDFDNLPLDEFSAADCIVDAIFGTGFVGNYPSEARRLAEIFDTIDTVAKLAVDVPLGVNAKDGSIDKSAIYRADATLALGFVKPGLVSYPAKEYVGKLLFDNIGLQNDDILSHFSFEKQLIDRDLAISLIPKRSENSNKGSFGKLLVITGSGQFPGAAHLSLEAAFRSGVGLVTYLGEEKLCDSLVQKLPEVIYKPFSISSATEGDLDSVLSLADNYTAILLGSGSSRSAQFRLLVERLLLSSGAPLILDADAINVLAEDSSRGRAMIQKAARKVILTPHPLELSRLSGAPIDYIQQNRLSFATKFASELGCILVLKGAATIVTDGSNTYINSSGSSALAKAGSGDILAGVISAFVASGTDQLSASAVSVYFHGLAADSLSTELSAFGVIPSDLPREIAKEIAKSLSV